MQGLVYVFIALAALGVAGAAYFGLTFTPIEAAVTAIAFVCWYSCVRHLGAGRAGLLIGVVPLTAAAVGCWLGGQAPSLFVWVGTIVVGVGLVLGLAHGRTGQSRHPEGP